MVQKGIREKHSMEIGWILGEGDYFIQSDRERSH